MTNTGNMSALADGQATNTRPDGAPKSCSTCTKRRIRCDRSYPGCWKCSKKGLACPGYGRRLRWANGVAARGKLKGQKLPVELPYSTEEELPSLAPSGSAQQTPLTASAQSQVALRTASPDFIEYYDRYLAGLMVWIDSDENDYRRRVLPLAAETPGLRLAIAALAAHHAPRAFPQEASHFPEAARDACLAIVQRRVHDMTTSLAGGLELSSTDMADAEWMLACILMISCYEMANSQIAAAEGHRMAARRLVNIFEQRSTCDGQLFVFLRNQLSIYDIFASTTSFDVSEIERAILPISGTDMFSDYLSVLHEVTLESRRTTPPAATRAVEACGQVSQRFSASAIRGRFSQARGTALMAAGKLRLEPAHVRRDFIRLVDMHYHAGILYAYRCFGHSDTEVADRISAASQLLEQLLELESPALLVQNLPWPVFIAGTESHGDTERQKAVVSLFATISETLGFKNSEGVLSFLTTFWSSPQSDWQAMARDFYYKGVRILAV